ncbi:L-threonylcarbamoyladenylate synthase [Ureaplasma miroungigenitalium]|uniref:L-threonylcarbamoyladenylate synthase n=1 Tax=Ureaplasma miroungigenitalium TaxID=1042321 RepID=UPI0021E7AC2C|nr:L-threonylcarbamoyladenylate synthase [Ureaplasma miroungigenitalium]MCV3734494.1 L-threonylcarbamoyladenylate synthase [Ureaplasma miroungigenitalium]
MKTYNFNQLNIIADALAANKCVVLPTDTIMGILAKNEKNIYALKKRPANKPIVRFIADYSLLGELTVAQKQFLDIIWPGQITIIKDHISYRMPNSRPILKLLEKLGPLYCSSANLSGEDPVLNEQEAVFKFGAKDNVLYVQGNANTTEPSTIIDIDEWKYIRRGASVGVVDEFLADLHANKSSQID